MAKKSRNYDANHGERTRDVRANRPIKVGFADFRFVRVELTEAEKAEFRALLTGGEFDVIDFDGWVRDGYKLSLTYDEQHSSFIATLTAQYRDMPNAGLVLTGRGKTVAAALAVLEFKDRYLAGDDGWAAAEQRRGGSYDDVG